MKIFNERQHIIKITPPIRGSINYIEILPSKKNKANAGN